MEKATENMVEFAKNYGYLESDEDADEQSKMWIIRHLIQSYLSIQYVGQAFKMLEKVQKGKFGVEPSSRFYDPFTNYYGVRGK